MIKIIFVFAGLSGLVSVTLGAFGAHGLRGKLDDRLMHAFETGTYYQMSHTLVLILCCLMIEHWGRHWSLEIAAYAFALGIILFSGSLYCIAILDIRWLGPVTPVGGLCFMVGWCLLTVGIWQRSGLGN